MEDRELLEFAAKACGIRLEWDGHPDQWQPMFYEGKTYHSWNPLEDDGDALRLAIRLSIHVKRYSGSTTAQQWTDSSSSTEHDHWKINGNDEMKSTRRSIVRAAAEIGKAMP